MLQLAPEAVRDTLATIFAQPGFERGLRQTLWSRFTGWLWEMVNRLTGLTASSPALAWTLRVAVVLAVALLVARLAYVMSRRGPAGAARAARAAGGGAGRDPWRSAQAEADAGRYTEAAHLLYAALLQALAARERLRLHPAKTLGDYTRELRARSSGALAGFRDFARDYETVVYGHRPCDRDRYERLNILAARLAERHG